MFPPALVYYYMLILMLLFLYWPCCVGGHSHVLSHRLRAQAFHSNEYVDSDMAWMDVAKTSPLEIVIGPYEVYSDALFGYKVCKSNAFCDQPSVFAHQALSSAERNIHNVRLPSHAVFV